MRLSDIQLAVVTECQLRGMNSSEISQALLDRTGRRIDARNVRVILKEQRDLWARKREQDIDFYMNQELARLEMMEREAWRQYGMVGGTVQRETIDKLFDSEEMLIQKSVKVETRDDPNQAHKWFTSILNIQQSRRKMLKLESAVTFQANVVAMKSYVDWSPDQWPNPPQQLDDPNVVEGEIDVSSD